MRRIEQHFRRFAAIDRDYCLTDKHIHSAWADGEGSIMQIAQRAQEIGLTQIAITEHIRGDSTYFNRYCEEIKQAGKQVNIDILVGFEAKIKNFQGDIDVPEEAIKKAQVKIASVHRFPVGSKLYQPREFKKVICQEIELELSLAAVKNGRFNVLGHPGGMSLITYGEFSLNFFKEIIFACKKHDIAFELNSFYHRAVFEELIALLEKYNLFVSIGSDAHTLSDIGNSLGMLQQAGIYG